MDSVSGRAVLETFIGSGVDRPTLGLVYGRRRIGKSTLLASLARAQDGFYWEATRTESTIHRTRLGEALGGHLGVGRLSLETWDDAVSALLRVGEGTAAPVVLDEFGYLMEADPALASIISSALGPARRPTAGKARLILCGSAIAMMGALTAGQAPLRGRAGLELVMEPFGFRTAAGQFGLDSNLELATRVYAVIGGVVGYGTDMVDHDLPRSHGDFVRWLATRVLSPAATLHHEATTLMAEDPTLSTTSASVHHSILGAIANGAVTAGTIANRIRRTVSNLDPALKRLVAAGFVVRHEDPIRRQRPLYALADPFLQFHYAILEPHRSLLRDRNPDAVWSDRLGATFDARVRGPVFEEQARQWVRRHAEPATLGGPPDHVGPSLITAAEREFQIDVVVAADDPGAAPSERRVVALGEAKAGETLGRTHLDRLVEARAALGPRAAGAKLLLFGFRFKRELRELAESRPEVEIVDLERLYRGV